MLLVRASGFRDPGERRQAAGQGWLWGDSFRFGVAGATGTNSEIQTHQHLPSAPKLQAETLSSMQVPFFCPFLQS